MPHFVVCPFDESIKQSTYLYIIYREKKKNADYTRRNLSFESNQGHDDDVVFCVYKCIIERK
jgi:hypothetical protein